MSKGRDKLLQKIQDYEQMRDDAYAEIEHAHGLDLLRAKMTARIYNNLASMHRVRLAERVGRL